ncbi:hypothetical protein [Streptomyces sp. NPDC018610]|uniref:hypothetical protein n=1 Tax=Streptomyces sp. NPDC018610 TaxID=3365049 RepID=UPI0037977298
MPAAGPRLQEAGRTWFQDNSSADFFDDYTRFLDSCGIKSGDRLATAWEEEFQASMHAVWTAVREELGTAQAQEAANAAQEADTRRQSTRADRRDTWTMTGDILYLNGVGFQSGDANIEEQVRRNQVRVNTAAGHVEPVLNQRYHVHASGGSHGAAIVFLLDADFRVRPCIYDYASTRSDNKYKWWNGGTDYNSSANVPDLQASIDRVGQLGGG